MAIHFSEREFAARRRAATKAMAKRGLDGLLMFRQESMYYLTGHDTFGYCFFQCLYLGADGTMTLLTRLPDAQAAKHTSVIEDIRAWHNVPGANPAEDLRVLLEEHGCRTKRLGIELDAYGLTGLNYTRVEAALTGFCNIEDASDLVTRLRVVKSAKELAYCRKAGALADAALVEANRLAIPGAFEGDILAAMQGAVFKGDGEYSGNEFVINSGELAVLGRYLAGRRHLDARDQLTIEWAGAYRHYHAAMMRTILVGGATKAQRKLHAAAVDAHRTSAAVLKPGKTCGDVFDAHAQVLSKAGYKHMTATGYSMGATYAPTWMDWPMFWHGNDFVIQPGMVFFIHTMAMTRNEQHAQSPGQSYIVTEKGNEPLSRIPMDLVVNG